MVLSLVQVVFVFVLVLSCVQCFPSVSRLVTNRVTPVLSAVQPSKSNNFSFFNSPQAKQATPKKPQYSTITIPPNYNVALGALGLAGALAFAQKYGAAVPLGLIGTFLFIQTGKIRFLFDNEAIEVVVSKKEEKTGEEKLAQTRENFAVGGRNRWKYNTITDWFFIPSKDFPVLVYFNEIQTSPKGQIHFFPVLMDGKALYETMSERIGDKRQSK